MYTSKPVSDNAALCKGFMKVVESSCVVSQIIVEMFG